MTKKIILAAILLILVVGGIFGYSYYQKVFGESINKTGFIFIKSTDQLQDVIASLKDFGTDEDDFLWVAEKKKFSNIKGGKYQLTTGMSNNDVINLLRSGNQTPVEGFFQQSEYFKKFGRKNLYTNRSRFNFFN